MLQPVSEKPDKPPAANDGDYKPSSKDRDLVVKWLIKILKEDNQEMIDEVLNQCATHIEARRYFVNRAKNETSRPFSPLFTICAFVQITCEKCRHFEPLHKHGKGAGRCKAGVPAPGASGLWWSADQHYCAEYKTKDAL